MSTSTHRSKHNATNHRPRKEDRESKTPRAYGRMKVLAALRVRFLLGGPWACRPDQESTWRPTSSASRRSLASVDFLRSSLHVAESNFELYKRLSGCALVLGQTRQRRPHTRDRRCTRTQRVIGEGGPIRAALFEPKRRSASAEARLIHSRRPAVASARIACATRLQSSFLPPPFVLGKSARWFAESRGVLGDPPKASAGLPSCTSNPGASFFALLGSSALSVLY